MALSLVGTDFGWAQDEKGIHCRNDRIVQDRDSCFESSRRRAFPRRFRQIACLSPTNKPRPEYQACSCRADNENRLGNLPAKQARLNAQISTVGRS
jgi:hypothetical protein